MHVTRHATGSCTQSQLGVVQPGRHAFWGDRFFFSFKRRQLRQLKPTQKNGPDLGATVFKLLGTLWKKKESQLNPTSVVKTQIAWNFLSNLMSLQALWKTCQEQPLGLHSASTTLCDRGRWNTSRNQVFTKAHLTVLGCKVGTHNSG